MSCDPLEIRRGEDSALNFEFTSENLQFVFTITAPAVAPTPGDIYSLGTGIFVVSSISGTTIRLASNLSAFDSLPSITGTLTKMTGSGDNTLTYSAYTTNSYVDLTGATIIIRAKDSPDTVELTGFPITIVIDSTNSIPASGIVHYVIPNATTATMPVGLYEVEYELIDVNSKSQLTSIVSINIIQTLKTP